jgi:hypothetical protein
VGDDGDVTKVHSSSYDWADLDRAFPTKPLAGA